MKLQREVPNRPYAVCRGRFDRWHIYEHTINGWHWIASFRYDMMAEQYKDDLNDAFERGTKWLT